VRRLVLAFVILSTAAMVGVSWWKDARAAAVPANAGTARVAITTRAELAATVRTMEARLAANPTDADAVLRLAEALIRVQRVDADAEAVVAAERHLRAFLAKTPEHYDAQRLLGAVLLSQHRYRDALREAHKARAIEPRDAWNFGVIGDAHLELGEYDDAFAAFDKMGQLRPGPPAYARVAYALELKGDLDGALEYMRMAAEGTSAHDVEGQAWHYAQLGQLLMQQGRLGDARREFERAAFTFPGHPYAQSGLARVKMADGDLRGALALLEEMHGSSPSPELAFTIGDLYARLGDAARAESLYRDGERLEREGWESEEPQPQALARFLAERNRSIPEAVRLAEEAAAKRRDIHTMDALAWAYFKAGRVQDALRASEEATRTGTRDARILQHAAAIRAEQGDATGAQALRQRAAVPLPDVALAEPPIYAVATRHADALASSSAPAGGSTGSAQRRH
jgi:tetratricopeptide (TPR) repeat protein